MKKRLRSLNKRTGFTLVETMTSLMIFSLIVLAIGIVFRDVQNENSRDLTTQFQSYLNTIETQHYKLKDYDGSRLTLIKDRKVYFIEFKPSKHQLVMTTDKGGYVLLMDNVKGVDWRCDHNVVDQRVTMMGGEQFNGKSWLNG